MSRRWLLSLLCLSVLILSVVQLTSAGGEFRVNEAKSKVLFAKERAEVVLAIENSTGETQNATVEVELLDPNGNSRFSTSQVRAITTGKRTLSLPLSLSFSDLAGTDRAKLLWYRLHYRVIGTTSSHTLSDGIVSLSGITPDLFEVRLIAPEISFDSRHYRARVQASHPLDQQPSANVHVHGELTFKTDNDRSLTLRASKITDAKGQAYLDFVLPPRFPESSDRTPEINGEINVTAQRGAVVSEASGNVDVDRFTHILISTDKPLYQPGQVMHVRALMFTSAKYAIANQDCMLTITDPEGLKVYRTVARTSRFGVVNADWTIPENIRLGHYLIRVGLEGDDESAQMHQEVRISRYDLPNFSVNVETDRKFYLPGQNAEVKVRADYLFGKPVTQGDVRVVRETMRRWDYGQQKWNIDEGEKYEGKTDSQGLFVAHINLAEPFQNFNDEGYDDEHFKDLNYSAYFTDPTTSRTEQRRFALRVTKQAIHVYVVQHTYKYHSGLPLGFYISTFYADGSPASCQVRAKLVQYGDAGKPISATSPVVQTNRYGLAKVSGIRWPREFEDRDIELSLSAFDSKGRGGWNKRTLKVSDEPAIRVGTDKALYRAGEPINATITSSLPNETVNVDLIQNTTVIRSDRVTLHDGRGWISFAYKPDMKDRLTVAAYGNPKKSEGLVDAHTVLYPEEPELKVSLQSSQGSYRPGEEATIDLKVRRSDRDDAQSVLGLVVFDKAVEERFRTDQEFGSAGSGFFESVQNFLGFNEELAGVTSRDLQRKLFSRTVPPEYELLAEFLLNRDVSYHHSFHGGDDYDLDEEKLFQPSIRSQLAPLTQALADRYVHENEYPNNEENLRRFLQPSRIDLDALRDPWGTPYRAAFSIHRESDVLDIMTAGADKRFGTEDDFSAKRLEWPYFPTIGVAINNAVFRYHERTGGYIRDVATLREELTKNNFNLEQLRDRWGQPYRFEFDVQESNYVTVVKSGGPDKKFSIYDPADDFLIWASSIDYFAEQRARIETELTQRFTRIEEFPENDQRLRDALPDLGTLIEGLRDPWGREYYPFFKIQPLSLERSRLETRTRFGDPASTRTEVVPATGLAAYVGFRSRGPDGLQDTRDDFPVATFSAIWSDGQTKKVERQPATTVLVPSKTYGAIYGLAMDPLRAVVGGATVTLKREIDGHRYQMTTSDEGTYWFASLLPGLYVLRFDVPGFKSLEITGVWVRAASLMEINAPLEVGAISEAVTVTASSSRFDVQNSTLGNVTRRHSRINIITKSGTQEASTPRLREYFPETLVWQPSLETDREGRAQFNFKLADNITTWKVAVIASTEDGRIATTEKEIKAFQPFFVEHEPPRVLTEGDEISLPVVVRNYLEQSQNVNLEIKPESWFALLGPARKQSTVAPNDAKRETFDFRAVSSVADGKQRIIAIGSGADDAIEKPITVHPDGEEVSVTAGDVFGNSASLELEVPENVIPNSSRAELKIYPNLMAHVSESVEAIMARPYGCGEQTISSTYPSLLLLRQHKLTGVDFAMRGRAERYLESGYRRLLNYRADNGGFSYWGGSDADLALTAYALRFLTEASDIIDVDQDVVTQAHMWLIKQQQKNGSWQWNRYLEGKEDVRSHAMLTAYITRILLLTQSNPQATAASEVATAHKLAFDYLKQTAKQIDDPYMLAAYALIAIDLKEWKEAKLAIDRLGSLAKTADGVTHWSVRTSTPFFGWGSAGNVETTALALQALNRYCKSAGCASETKLISEGLRYVFKRKDRYGVWQSTQATINVLDAMMAMFSQATSTGESTADIVVNGRAVKTIQVPAANRLVDPLTVDLGKSIQTGRNRIEIRRADGSPVASVQAVVGYYFPWAAANHVETKVLHLLAKFDKTEARIGETITCDVEAYRTDSSGYGMLLAEIGLPPGADVDRSSLETAMQNSNQALNRYDVLPDRVVVYMWPRGSAVKFSFKFRPRFGVNAKSAPSFIYDYYNPEARAILAPVTFRVK